MLQIAYSKYQEDLAEEEKRSLEVTKEQTLSKQQQPQLTPTATTLPQSVSSFYCVLFLLPKSPETFRNIYIQCVTIENQQSPV